MDSGVADSTRKNHTEAQRGRLIEEIGPGSGAGLGPVPGSIAPLERESGGLDFMEDIKRVKTEEEKDVETEEEDIEEDSSQTEILSCALGILVGILSLGKAIRSRREEESLRALLWPLQVISYRETDEAIAQTATDAALLLLTRSCSNSSSGAPHSHTLTLSRAGSGTADTVNVPERVSPANLPMPSSSRGQMGYQRNENRLQGDDGTQHLSVFQVSLFTALKDSCCSQEPYVRALGVHSISSSMSSTAQVC